MHLQRLAENKVKIIVNEVDLINRGLTFDHIWTNSTKLDDFFYDIIEKVIEEFSVDDDCSLSIEIFTQQLNKITLIVTLVDTFKDDNKFDDNLTDLTVKLHYNKNALYKFSDFENVIKLAHSLDRANLNGGTLYSYNDEYFLYFSEESDQVSNIVPLLGEYGVESFKSIVYIEQYGKNIINDNAVKTIVHNFSEH